MSTAFLCSFELNSCMRVFCHLHVKFACITIAQKDVCVFKSGMKFPRGNEQWTVCHCCCWIWHNFMLIDSHHSVNNLCSVHRTYKRLLTERLTEFSTAQRTLFAAHCVRYFIVHIAHTQLKPFQWASSAAPSASSFLHKLFI